MPSVVAFLAALDVLEGAKGMSREKRDYLRVALDAVPLDRVRLMKTAFLVWHKQGRPRSGPFAFEPYLYGPCAFDLYTSIEQLERRGEIVRAPHPVWRPGAQRPAPSRPTPAPAAAP